MLIGTKTQNGICSKHAAAAMQLKGLTPLNQMDPLVHCEIYSGGGGATSMLMVDVWWYENLTDLVCWAHIC